MMLHPSYQELIDKINEVNKEQGLPEIDSRYGLVIAAAKRARALVDGKTPTVTIANTDRKLSEAVAEMDARNIAVRIEPDDGRESGYQGDGITLMNLADAQVSED